MKNICRIFGGMLILITSVSCALSRGDAGEQIAQRAAQIAVEPAGDYWVGRRYHIPQTRFWGYLRKPRKPWSNAKITIFNEHQKLQPDRVFETDPRQPPHGHDHNFEYKIKGYFSNQKIYDPNSNLVLPEFVLTDYTLLNRSPGFLFHPKERNSRKYLPSHRPRR